MKKHHESKRPPVFSAGVHALPRRAVSVLTLMLLCSATTATSGETRTWGEVGLWEILVDPEAGNGCFARRTFEDQTEVRIGFVPNRKGGYFAAYNPAWTDIRDGAFDTVEFDFGDTIFAGEAVGRPDTGIPGGYAFFDNPEFAREFAKRTSVKISTYKGRALEIDLKGSSRAIDAAFQCQKEQPQTDADG